MNRVAVLCVLLLALLTGQLTLAQGCLPEQEPNDSPVEANPLTDSCISGHLSSGDQDAFSWSLSEEDSRRPWQLELTSVRSQLTNLDVFRVEFTDDGSGVLGYDTLFQLTSPDGRLVTSEPQLFPPGDYTLGLSVSGGEGSYTVALLPGEPLRDFRNDQTAVLEMTAGFNNSGYLRAHQQCDWTIPAELADHLWHLELDAAVGETPTLSIHGPDGTMLQSATASGGGASLSSLGLSEGVHRLEVSSDSGIIAPYSLRATSQGARTAGQELEPNDSLEQANALTFGEELRGTLASGGDTDFFRFSVDEEQSTRLLELHTGTDAEMQVCLLDEHGRDLQCRRGAGARLSDLLLQPGVYGVAINPSDRERDIDYALLLRDAGEPDPLRPTEPNDRFDQAFPLPEQLGVRGQLHGDETDFVSVEITGEPQLWRVQVNGAGAGELQLYKAEIG